MRLDKYLADNLFPSRTKAARALQKGLVFINGKIGKPSDEVHEGDVVTLAGEERPFVSEGGYKLQKALDEFRVDLRGKTVVDLGASTGGFTDCLLRAGVSRVYAVDVGENQLDGSLLEDERVVVRDRCNARYLTAQDFPESIDIVTSDVSFISLTLVLPAVAAILREGGQAITLIKPQFEVGQRGLGKHGIVKDVAAREGAVCTVCAAAERLGLSLAALTNAPLRDRKNVEYLAHFVRGGPSQDVKCLIAAVANALREEGRR